MHGHTHRLEHIGAAALRRERPVPVLHHPGTRTGCDEHRRRRDIEEAGLVTTRPAELEKGAGTRTIENRNHRTAQKHPGESGKFGCTLPARVQRDEEAFLRLVGNIGLHQ